MKILLVEPLGDGGIAHYTYNLANSLVAEGCEISLFTSYSYELETYVRHFESHQSMFQIASKLIHRFPSLANERGIYNVIRRIGIIHIQSINEIELLLIACLRLAGFLIIFTVHNIFPRHGQLLFYHKYLYRFMYYLCDQIIIHTWSGKKQLIDLFLVKDQKISVIPHGNYSFFLPSFLESCKFAREKLGLGLADKVVLFFGAIRPNKGLETLLLAISLLKEKISNIKLFIAGEPCEDFNRYRQIMNHEKLDKIVITKLEYIKNDEVAMYFSAADLVALPYHEVTGSGVLHIAYAFGKPVVATNLEGFKESVVNGKNGYLVPDNDPFSLAKSIEEILQNSNKRKQMGHFSQHLSQSVYSWPNIAKATKSLYENILA